MATMFSTGVCACTLWIKLTTSPPPGAKILQHPNISSRTLARAEGQRLLRIGATPQIREGNLALALKYLMNAVPAAPCGHIPFRIVFGIDKSAVELMHALLSHLREVFQSRCTGGIALRHVPSPQ
jgi:hypothetical protein